MKKILFSVVAVMLIAGLSLTVSAHPGRTDSKGGHWNRKTGTYHYHNGGGSSGGTQSSGNSSVSSTPKTVYATKITAKNVPSDIVIGKTVRLKASVYPTNAQDSEIFWESSDESIVKVASNGELTAVGVGKATVTAKTSHGASKKFTVNVNGIRAEAISIADNRTEILIGETEKFNCAFTPSDTTDKSLEWSSSDDEIISVSSDGTIKASRVGTATVTAKHNKLADSLTVTVKPIEAESIRIVASDTESTDKELKLKKGRELSLNAEIAPENATYKQIVWSVSDNSIATVDMNGKITAKTVGTVTVIATAQNGINAQAELEVYSDSTETAVGVCIVLGAVIGFAAYRRKKHSEKKKQ